MFQTLTEFQKGLIQDYRKLAKNVYFLGIDGNNLPVVTFADANGMRPPFSILHRPRKTMSVRSRETIPVERTTTEPAYPIRWFTEEELDFIDPRSHELLTGLKRVYHT